MDFELINLTYIIKLRLIKILILFVEEILITPSVV